MSTVNCQSIGYLNLNKKDTNISRKNLNTLDKVDCGCINNQHGVEKITIRKKFSSLTLEIGGWFLRDNFATSLIGIVSSHRFYSSLSAL